MPDIQWFQAVPEIYRYLVLTLYTYSNIFRCRYGVETYHISSLGWKLYLSFLKILHWCVLPFLRYRSATPYYFLRHRAGTSRSSQFTRGSIDHIDQIQPMRAANSDFASLSVLKTANNHCLPPTSAGNGQLSPRIITVCRPYPLEMVN